MGTSTIGLYYEIYGGCRMLASLVCMCAGVFSFLFKLHINLVCGTPLATDISNPKDEGMHEAQHSLTRVDIQDLERN